jgi:hypothetical protein
MTTTQPAPTATSAGRWSPAQRFAFLFGAVYFLVGVAGFPVTGISDFAGDQHHHALLIFSVNPLHNVVHIVLGLAWLAGSARHRTARVANVAMGVVLGLVTLLGFVGGMGMLGMAGLADPDNFLHLATATVSLYFGSVAAGTPGRSGTPAA